MTDTHANDDALTLGRFIFGHNPYGDMHALGQPHVTQPYQQQYREPRHPGDFNKRPQDRTSPDGSTAFQAYDLDGLADGYFNAQGNRLTTENLDQLRAIPQDGIWWYFEGKPRYVAKAIRVPVVYTITDSNGQNPSTVQDFLLIGFEGAGW